MTSRDRTGRNTTLQPGLQWQRQDRSKAASRGDAGKSQPEAPVKARGQRKWGRGAKRRQNGSMGRLLTRGQPVLLFLQSHSGHPWELLPRKLDRGCAAPAWAPQRPEGLDTQANTGVCTGPRCLSTTVLTGVPSGNTTQVLLGPPVSKRHFAVSGRKPLVLMEIPNNQSRGSKDHIGIQFTFQSPVSLCSPPEGQV